MSFWEDSSPVVKGAIVVGALGLLYFAIAFFAGLAPFTKVEETTQQRGLQPPASQ